MLQAPSHLSKVYGHGHIKKFWLMQTQKESENKALLASSSSSSSRHGTSSAGKGHEGKHSPQLSSGNSSARTLSAGTASPSGLPIRSLIASSGGYGAATAAAAGRHVSLVTCAESLILPLRSDHPRLSFRPSSPNITESNTKEENDLQAEDADCTRFKSPHRGSDLSASSSRCCSPLISSNNDTDPSSHCGSPLISSNNDTDLAGNTATADELEQLKVTNANRLGNAYHISVHDGFSPGKDSAATHQDDVCLQENFEYAKSYDNTHFESHSLDPYNSDSGNFDRLASPVWFPRKGLLEKKVKSLEGKPSAKGWTCNISSEGKPFGKVWTAPVPSFSKRGLGKGKSPEACREDVLATKYEVSSEDANPTHCSVVRTCSLCGTSKTPLWRSGPQGPKSLCNACGIRFKKSKRCSGPIDSPDHLASPLASPESTKVSSRPLKRKQETLLSNAEALCPRDLGSEVATAGVTSQQAKKSRWSKLMMKGELSGRGEVTGSSGESSLTWNLHSPSSVSPPSVTEFGVVGKDEEAAAALLMYLSCGLVYA